MAVIATGFFDGVHIGHRLVLATLVEEARRRGEESVVLTFWPHPRTVLQNDAISLRLLTSLVERTELLKSVGVDRVEVIPFTREFSRMTTAEYLKSVVIQGYCGTAILLGYDNRLGSDTSSPEQTELTARELGLDVVRTERVSSVGIDVSSTKIRAALSRGDVKTASSLLCYDYPLHGVVVAGKQEGRQMGFPTANMQLYEPLKLIPAEGVYLTRVDTLGKQYYGITNVGKVIETHILDFDEMLYGLDIRISFLERLRDEMQFPSIDELKLQIARDKQQAEILLKSKN